MKPTVSLTKSGKGISFINAAIGHLKNAKIYVGIPEAKTSRPGKITNAALMYIHTNGSSVMNIPKRPVIEPSIEADKKKLEAILGKAASAELDGNSSETEKLLNLAGRRAANNAKRWFTSPENGWPRNKSATIRRKLGALKGKQSEAALTILEKAGEDGDVSSIDTPLIDTGALRRSITYVADI